jgi:hypothetical protein
VAADARGLESRPVTAAFLIVSIIALILAALLLAISDGHDPFPPA